MKAKVSMSRTSNSKGGSQIRITIEDDSSSLIVCEVSMSLQNFADAVTGMGMCNAEFVHLPNLYTTQRYGKEKIVEQSFCDKVRGYNGEQEVEVQKHFAENHERNGWELWSDGTGTQQPGAMHRYLICKYVSNEEGDK